MYEKLRCNSTVKIRFGRKNILNYAYVLKNGVGRYNIFFNWLHIACWILLFCVVFVYNLSMFLFFHDLTCVMCTFPSSTNNFAHAQALSRMSSVRSYEYCAGKHWKLYWMQENHSIKQRRISFVLGYLRMILWKISTAISIKHRILATFNIEKKFNSDSLYAFKFIFL